MSQAPKKKNHEVTKGYLKRWESESGQLWMFDIEKQITEVRSLEAKFAIRNYLYVPEISGKRDDATENWFSGAENELVNFIDRLNTKNYTLPIKGDHLYLTILGLIGLSLRSAYDLQSIEKLLIDEPDLGEKLGIDISTESARHRFVVENMIAQIDSLTKKFCGATITVVFNTNRKLLVCDRPGADLGFISGGMHFIPVGPNDYVFMDLNGLLPAMAFGASFAPSGTSEDIVTTINNHTISRARRWVVAQSREELDAISSELTLEKVEMRKLSDKKTFIPLSEEERRKGWRLKDPV